MTAPATADRSERFSCGGGLLWLSPREATGRPQGGPGPAKTDGPKSGVFFLGVRRVPVWPGRDGKRILHGCPQAPWTNMPFVCQPPRSDLRPFSGGAPPGGCPPPGGSPPPGGIPPPGGTLQEGAPQESILQEGTLLEGTLQDHPLQEIALSRISRLEPTSQVVTHLIRTSSRV